MTSDSLPETGEAEDCGTTSLKDWKKKLSIQSLISSKISFRSKDEIQTLLNFLKKKKTLRIFLIHLLNIVNVANTDNKKC